MNEPEADAVNKRWDFTSRRTDIIGMVCAAVICSFFLGLFWGLPKKKPEPPGTTWSATMIGNCQFITFSNPFFIIHWPKCTNHVESNAK